MKLWPHQQQAILSLFNYFRAKKGNPIVAMPTGTGKSFVIGAFIRNVMEYPGQRVLVLTHVKELIEQNYKAAKRIYPELDAGIYSAGLGKRQTDRPVIFAGIASVHRRIEEFGSFDIVLIDECHLVSDKSQSMYFSTLRYLKSINSRMKIIGLSATPYRLSSGLLTDGKIFDDVCCDLTDLASFNKFIDDGYLAPLVAKQPEIEFDVDDIRIQAGEYVLNDLQRAVGNAGVSQRVVQELITRSEGRKHWLIFATGIEHAIQVTDLLIEAGVEATVVHSKIEKEERDARIARFKEGRVTAIVNNNILTTGVDVPQIDLIGMLRPTVSPGLWVQMLGRGLRVAPRKNDCLVLDFAGNTKRLGPINNVILPQKKKRQAKGVRLRAPVKVCPQCRTINLLNAKVCTLCAYEFPKRVRLDQQPSNLPLIAQQHEDKKLVPVTKVTYRKHTKKGGGTPTLKVTYVCGLTVFHEWVCLEHNGYARRRAVDWWKRRADFFAEIPATVDSALKQTETLKVPKSIRVNLLQKYPEIVEYFF